MNRSQSGGYQLVARAKQGDAQALDQLLEQHRGYLKVLAQRVLDGRSTARIDAAAAVQQTCLLVHRSIGEFGGQSPAEFLAWLRQLHERNLQHQPEESLTQQQVTDRDTCQKQNKPPEAGTLPASPDQTVLQNETQKQLAAALDQLPGPQQQAMQLRYGQLQTVRQIAVSMNCSEQAAAALIYRALLVLGGRLNQPHP